MSSQQLVLTFHGLGEPPRPVDAGEAECWVPLDWFAALVDAARRDADVAITFDDGNASDLEEALPRLERAGAKAAFFVLPGKFGGPGYLDASGARRLRSAGMAVGSHGLHHRDWRAADDDELGAEVRESSRQLTELLGEPVDMAAVPFGSYDRRVLKVAHGTYRKVFTSDGGPSRPDDWLVARTTIHTGRPLEHWVDLVAGWRRSGPDLKRSARRLAKRWR